MHHRGILLAGGRSRRMGTDKTQLQFQGGSFLSATFDKMKQGLGQNFELKVSGEHPNYSHFVDLIPGRGPIEGIWSCIQDLQLPAMVFVIPVDLPLLRTEQVRTLVSTFNQVGAGTGKIQMVRYRPSELPFVFVLDATTKSALQIVREQEKSTFRSISAFQMKLQTLMIENIDEQGLENVNTPEDFGRIQSLGRLEL